MASGVPVLHPDYDLVECRDGTVRRVKQFLPRMDQHQNWQPGLLPHGEAEVEVSNDDQFGDPDDTEDEE